MKIRECIAFNNKLRYIKIIKCLLNIYIKTNIIYKVAYIVYQNKPNKIIFTKNTANSYTYRELTLIEDENFSFSGPFNFEYLLKYDDNDNLQKTIKINSKRSHLQYIYDNENETQNRKIIYSEEVVKQFNDFFKNFNEYIEALKNAQYQFKIHSYFSLSVMSLKIIRHNLKFLKSFEIPENYPVNQNLIGLLKNVAKLDERKSTGVSILKRMKCGALELVFKKDYVPKDYSHYGFATFMYANYLGQRLFYCRVNKFIDENNENRIIKTYRKILSFIIDNYKTGNKMLDRMKKKFILALAGD